MFAWLAHTVAWARRSRLAYQSDGGPSTEPSFPLFILPSFLAPSLFYLFLYPPPQHIYLLFFFSPSEFHPGFPLGVIQALRYTFTADRSDPSAAASRPQCTHGSNADWQKRINELRSIILSVHALVNMKLCMNLVKNKNMNSCRFLFDFSNK